MSINGKKIVLTGAFTTIDRKDAHAQLEAMGADVTGSVSGKTDMLFAGARAGSKLAKAEKAGVPVYGETELLVVLESGQAPGEAGEAVPRVEEAIDTVVQAVTPKAIEAVQGRSKAPTFIEYPEHGPYRETNASGVVTCEGQFVHGKRSGTWTWRHPAGTMSCRREYVDGKAHGQELSWYADGALEAEGLNVDGLREGKWVWRFATGELKGTYTYNAGKQEGPYEWWHTPNQRHSVGAFRADRHMGDWTWWNTDGVVDTIRGYNAKGQFHGMETVNFQDGSLSRRGNWIHSKRDGAWVENYGAGKPKEKAVYVDGQYDGVVETWDASGKVTTREYARGLPTDLTAKKLTSIAKKIRKQKESHAKMDAIGDVVDYGLRQALLLHLHARGILNLSEEPVLWAELINGAVSGAQLVDILTGIKSYATPEHPLGMLTSFWPRSLDELSGQVYARDPGPLDAAWADFPEPVKKGFALVLRRLGTLGEADIDGGVLADLAQVHVDEGLPDYLWMLTPDGPERAKVYGENRRPNEEFYRFLGLFGPREEWEAAVLQLAMENHCYFNTGVDAYKRASPAQLIALCNQTTPEIEHVYYCLDELRSDEPEELLVLAKTGKRGLAEPAAICAIRRLAGRGQPIPEVLDAAISFRGYHSSSGHQRFIGLKQTIEAMTALPQDRAQAIFERGFEDRYQAKLVLPVLAGFPEEGLRARAFHIVKAKAAEKHFDMDFIAQALARWGVEALPALHQQHQLAKPKALKDTFKRAIVVLLADLAEQGETWDVVYDAHIDFHGWSRAVDKHNYEHYVQPYVCKAASALPSERRERVLLGAFDEQHAAFHRPFACLKHVRTTAVWHAGFTALLDRVDNIKGNTKFDIQRVLGELGEDVDPWLRWCMENNPSPKLVGIFNHAFHDLDLRRAKWAQASGGKLDVPQPLHAVDELAKRIANFKGGGERDRIYLLKKVDAQPDGSLNRIGGCPPGIDVDGWPGSEEEPMEHLFTLDLDTMPELRGPNSKTRAVAMFINNAGFNEAWTPGNKDTQLVRLTQEAVDEGALDAPPGKPIRSGWFVPVPVEVPRAIWEEDLDPESDLGELRTAVYQANARVLGEPIWLQDGAHWGHLVLQFDQGFVDEVNLGDCGVMYAFTDTQFWQCH
jgi:antitoxin component YwqK of YwqJK toxin-antitoxin module